MGKPSRREILDALYGLATRTLVRDTCICGSCAVCRALDCADSVLDREGFDMSQAEILPRPALIKRQL